MKKQYIWLVRYGKTAFPLKENDGPYNSDIDPNEGVYHAQCIANQIASSIEISSSLSFPTTTIYCSPFLRCVHTASIIASKLDTKINIEEGLYEWLVPSLLIEQSTNIRTYPQSATELGSKMKLFEDTINFNYQSLNPYHIDESNVKFSFPEDESALLSRCDDTLNLILKNHDDVGRRSGNNNIIIVAHAPCVQSIAFAMEEGVADVKDSKLSKWPLGGITRFSRDVNIDFDERGCDGDGDGDDGNISYGEWNLDFYGLTDHMPGDYKKGAGLWSLSCFDK